MMCYFIEHISADLYKVKARYKGWVTLEVQERQTGMQLFPSTSLHWCILWGNCPPSDTSKNENSPTDQAKIKEEFM